MRLLPRCSPSVPASTARTDSLLDGQGILDGMTRPLIGRCARDSGMRDCLGQRQEVGLAAVAVHLMRREVPKVPSLRQPVGQTSTLDDQDPNTVVGPRLMILTCRPQGRLPGSIATAEPSPPETLALPSITNRH